MVFLGVKHPNPNIDEHDVVEKATRLASELGVLNRLVHFNFGWVDYDTRHEYLMDADAGVSCHLDNIETRFSFRTRILDYIWCGLPIISTEGDEFGGMLCEKGIGISTKYRDVNDWIFAIERLMNDKNFYMRCKNSVEVLRSEYRWSNIISPLKVACMNLNVSEDRLFIRGKIKFRKKNKLKNIFNRVYSIYSKQGFLGIFKKIFKKIV